MFGIFFIFQQKVKEYYKLIFEDRQTVIAIIASVISIISLVATLIAQDVQNNRLNNFSAKVNYCISRITQMQADRNYSFEKIDASIVKIKSVSAEIQINKLLKKTDDTPVDSIVEIFSEIIAISHYSIILKTRILPTLSVESRMFISPFLDALDTNSTPLPNENGIEEYVKRIDNFILHARTTIDTEIIKAGTPQQCS